MDGWMDSWIVSSMTHRHEMIMIRFDDQSLSYYISIILLSIISIYLSYPYINHIHISIISVYSSIICIYLFMHVSIYMVTGNYLGRKAGSVNAINIRLTSGNNRYR